MIAYIIDKVDTTVLKRINSDTVNLANNGSHICYFIKDPIVVPKHSNIMVKYFSGGFFYIRVVFSILKDGNKFTEIFVGGEKMGKFLTSLSFIHKSVIKYY